MGDEYPSYDGTGRRGSIPGDNGVNAPRVKVEGGSSLARYRSETIGWQATCACGAPTIPGIVLDPFSGMATGGVVAIKEGRRYLGCELNPTYAAKSRERLATTTPCLFVEDAGDNLEPDLQNTLF